MQWYGVILFADFSLCPGYWEQLSGADLEKRERERKRYQKLWRENKSQLGGMLSI
jgi:hypothetical protein